MRFLCQLIKSVGFYRPLNTHTKPYFHSSLHALHVYLICLYCLTFHVSHFIVHFRQCYTMNMHTIYIFAGARRSANPCTTESRLKRIERVCATQQRPCTDDLYHTDMLLVDSKHKVIHCSIPKVASSTMRSLLLSATSGQMNLKLSVNDAHSTRVTKRMGLSYLKGFKENRRSKMWENYYAFVAVRHPFDRLVSAYMDKFEHDGYSRKYSSTYCRLVNDTRCPIKEMRGKNSMTFPQFIDLITVAGVVEKHWDEYKCDPCCFKFDHIVKMETLQQDMVPVMNILFGNKTAVSPPHDHASNGTRKSKESFTRRMFSLLTDAQVAALLEIFSRDFELFGYRWDAGDTECGYSL